MSYQTRLTHCFCILITYDHHALSQDTQKAEEPGAVYVQGMGDGALPTPADENLPVATPIDAECVVAPPLVKYDDQKPAAITSSAQPAEKSRLMMSMQNDSRFGRKPCMMAACPHCGLESRTKIRTFPNLITWVMSILLLFLFWPLCWVPLVVDRVRIMREDVFRRPRSLTVASPAVSTNLANCTSHCISYTLRTLCT
jgi:hypothetical protein